MRKHKGFTLIELLVVIAIIAVLLAIMLPSMSKVRERVRETACKSNLRNVGVAVAMYLDAYDRRLSPADPGNGFVWYDAAKNRYTPATAASRTYWGVHYWDFLKETKIFGCPSLQRVPEGLIYNYSDYPNPAEVIQHAAYGLNHHPQARGRNTNTIYRMDEFLFCSDHTEPRCEAGLGDGFHNNDVPGGRNLTQYREGSSRFFAYRQIFRHNIRYSDPGRTGGRATLLWLDGHVSSLNETNGDDFPLRWYTGDKPRR